MGGFKGVWGHWDVLGGLQGGRGVFGRHLGGSEGFEGHWGIFGGVGGPWGGIPDSQVPTAGGEWVGGWVSPGVGVGVLGGVGE